VPGLLSRDGGVCIRITLCSVLQWPVLQCASIYSGQYRAVGRTTKLFTLWLLRVYVPTFLGLTKAQGRMHAQMSKVIRTKKRGLRVLYHYSGLQYQNDDPTEVPSAYDWR
jgi:hypothetical protein